MIFFLNIPPLRQLPPKTILITLRLISPFSKFKSPGYPYLFGGLTSKAFYKSQNAQKFMKTIFYDGIQNKLKQLYLQYLTALQTKNLDYLKSAVDPTLIKSITKNTQPVTLLNKNSLIQLFYIKNIIIQKIGFNRQYHDQYIYAQPKSQHNQFDFYHGISIKQNDQHYIINLFIVQVLFKSSIKLIKSNKISEIYKKQLEKCQQHLIQFQLQQKVKPITFFLWTLFNRVKYCFNQKKYFNSILKFSIGASKYSQWKIGDVDHLMEGNIPPVHPESLEEVDKYRKIQLKKKINK